MGTAPLSFKRWLRRLVWGAALALASARAQAPVDHRIAIVIGNAAYPGAPLANPANDAKAMSEVLESMGFRVIEARDASKAQMQAAVAQAASALKGNNGVGMLYYAGHGLQLDWHNYMVPVDARLASAAEVPAQTLDVQAVIDAFRLAGNRMNIVVLDACRDNPFPATANAKGLAPMDAPPGTLLAYATAPGNVADDGTSTSGNGLYTQYLVRELKQPSAKIEDVFKRVRFQVRKHSQGRQVPWESTSLEDDFYFDPKVRTVKLADAERAREAAEALARENAAWSRIKASAQPDDFFAFLQTYPNGALSEQAQFRLDQLQKARVVAQPGANGVTALASGSNRYALGDQFIYDEIDGFTKSATRHNWRVTSADNERVEINRGRKIIDQMGGDLLNRSGRKEPAVLNAPAELAVGKRWRSAFTNTPEGGTASSNYLDFKVVAFEEVTVPAGRFKAFKIERLGAASSPGGYYVLSGTHWIDPATMIAVRNDTLNRKTSGNGKGSEITNHSSFQLVSARWAARAATP